MNNFDYTKVTEVHELGAEEANRYLAAGWVLLGVEESSLPGLGPTIDKGVYLIVGWNKGGKAAPPRDVGEIFAARL